MNNYEKLLEAMENTRGKINLLLIGLSVDERRQVNTLIDELIHMEAQAEDIRVGLAD